MSNQPPFGHHEKITNIHILLIAICVSFSKLPEVARLESIVESDLDTDAYVHIVKAIEKCTTMDCLELEIGAAASRRDFSYYLITDSAPGAVGPIAQGRPLFCNWPSAWLREYMEDQSTGACPFANSGSTICEPLVWTHRDDRGIIADAPDMGSTSYRVALGSSLVIPAFGMQGPIGSAIFSGGKVDLDQATIAFLQATLLLVRDKLARLRFKQLDSIKRRLSKRERQVLTWTALGKSAWDISCIVGISEVTAHKHVGSAMKKLNAVNKAHAVAAALIAGEISL